MRTPDINKQLEREGGCSVRGAQMGRHQYGLTKFHAEPIRLYLQRVRLVDGDYDPGGAYWGYGTPLFCAFDAEGGVRWFVRAGTRAAAKQSIRGNFRKATFYR